MSIEIIIGGFMFRILIIFSLFFCVSCASKKLGKADVNFEKSRIIGGRLLAFHNGQKFEGKCDVMIDELTALNNFSVDEKGWFITDLPIGNHYIKSLTCSKPFNEPLEINFKKNEVKFKVAKGDDVIYLGDIKVAWKTDGKKLKVDIGIFSNTNIGSQLNYKKAVLNVQNNQKSFEFYYYKVNPLDKTTILFKRISFPQKVVVENNVFDLYL